MRVEMAADPISFLVEKIRAIPAAPTRIMIAIAGPPASGKSTMAEKLVTALNREKASAVLIPMDGFHLDNPILSAMGKLSRKGSPETFDSQGFLHSMRRLKSEPSLYLPSFDRTKDLSIAGSILISQDQRIAIVEGNYLCFDEQPWRNLAEFWDFSVYLDVPNETIEKRLVQRWLDHGYSQEDAERKANTNDLPNAERIASSVFGCDVQLRVADQPV